MSVNGISGGGFNYALLNLGNKSSQVAQKAAAELKGTNGENAFSSLAMRVANFQSEALGSIMGGAGGKEANKASGEGGISLSGLLASLQATAKTMPNQGAQAAFAGGRNISLFDPESAYKMMSTINGNDVAFKAQFSELNQMRSYVAEMQKDGASLGHITNATANSEITARLEKFAAQYNEWTQRFDGDMKDGGILAGTQAAQVSRRELDQSIKNVFNGAKDGLHGLKDLGFSIDPVTHQAVFDPAKLNAVLASNKHGAVDTVQEFSANFAKSAELLNSAGNFIPNRLNNLDRVIDYFAANKTSLQAEFGTGDAAKPTGQVAKALAAYEKINRLA